MLIVCIEPLKYNIQYNIWGKLYVFTDCKLIFKNFHFKISNKKYQIGLLSKIYAEAVVQRCSVKKLFLEISQNLKVNTCARVSFLVKLQASGLQCVKVFDPIFWYLECPLHTGLTVFSYDHDINILYLYLHDLYIKNDMHKTMFI